MIIFLLYTMYCLQVRETLYIMNTEIAWSLSRKLRRCFCGRAALLHYREAPLGRMADAPEFHRRIWAAHCRISDRKFLRQLLLQVMHRQFTAGAVNTAALLPELLENFHSAFDRMLLGQAGYTLISPDGSGVDFEAKRRELSGKLQAYSNLLTLGDWEQLLAIAPEKRRTLPEVLELKINELRCYASPLCAFSDHGKLHIVELRGGEFAGFESETALLHRFYAMNSCGRDPDKVESWVLDYESGKIRRFGEDVDFSDGLAKITLEAGIWKELMDKNLSDIIPDDPTKCANCVFGTVCRDL